MVDTSEDGAGVSFDEARACADEVIDAFARLHPAVLMSWNEWRDLREMIERQYMGWGEGAKDLVDDPHYIEGRRQPNPA